MKRNPTELLKFIFDSITTIAKIRNHEALLISLAQLGRDIVDADRCSIWIWDKVQNKLWTKVAQGVKTIELEAQSGIVGTAVNENKEFIINDVQNDPRFHAEIDKKNRYVTKTMIVIPMLNQFSEVIGAIQVMNKNEDGIFCEQDSEYLKLASTYAAESIETILLMEEIENTQRELIYMMGVIGENRSQETGNHVKRVAEYCYLLGELYGLSPKECKILRDVSPMHDLGKIGIKDAILNKPGRLNEEEMHVMKTHAKLGYEILKSSDLELLKAAAIVAHEHHEKYDGMGYPRGLSGDAIHIYGRITAIADVFDALGSARVYKPAWSDEKIFSFFKEESGAHFDPHLISLFFEHKDRFFEIRDRYRDV